MPRNRPPWREFFENSPGYELVDMVGESGAGSGADEVAEVAAAAAHAGQVKGGEVDVKEEIVGVSDDDGAILPKGQVDPVYEAKAIVLNRAVSLTRQS
jgi:hypothetical protein